MSGVDRITEIQSLTALVHVEGYVWCDKEGAVHSDTLNPHGYVEDGQQDYCQPINHRALYMEDDEPIYAPGTAFICYCECHGPTGFSLMPGKLAPPAMVPCNKCRKVHP